MLRVWSRNIVGGWHSAPQVAVKERQVTVMDVNMAWQTRRSIKTRGSIAPTDIQTDYSRSRLLCLSRDTDSKNILIFSNHAVIKPFSLVKLHSDVYLMAVLSPARQIIYGSDLFLIFLDFYALKQIINLILTFENFF